MAKSKKAYRPKDIYFDGKMHVIWHDNAHTSYSYFDLRSNCPCASCVDELTGEKILDDASIGADICPESSEYVGNYAIAFIWNDSHKTGIYTFKHLRDKYPHDTEAEALN
ncbi:MAG: DUF971 domain-containing protein [Proteobacteria bacterium]|nr:DUF971 domain-containing protein [Pseudomonadota bacterium]